MANRLRTSLASLGLVTLTASTLVSAGGCNAKVATVLSANADGGPGGPSPDPANPEVDSGDADGLPDEDRPLVPASKVDILLVVDNSASMADKSSLLASSIGTLLRNVAPGRDVHLGVITSSLGNLGGDACDETKPRANDRAHLRTSNFDGTAVPGAATGVLTYSGGGVDTFVSSAEALVRGVGQTGCGLEAQLEAMYRFLVQPDPWTAVTVSGSKANLEGLDTQVLAQRKAFLRPDSALVVLMLTDEDDSSADPLAINGQGWAFEANNFPGSKTARLGGNSGTTAPRGTSACATDPGSEACTSCVFAPADSACQTNQGFYAPDDDDLNVRFHEMKRRYGLDPQYPLARYINGLTKSVVPNRAYEHAVNAQGVVAPYTNTPNCTNPIFAAELPPETASGATLCNLARGPRSRELVVFGLLGGLPKELATATPDWDKIVGHDPANYNVDGIDPHMLQSTEPRPALAGPSSADLTDPIHGREYNTERRDLQFACTFALTTPRTCAVDDGSCDCSPGSTLNPPLCNGTQQIRGKAYPTIRPLRVAQGLGDRAVVGSVCAGDYTETMNFLTGRLTPRLAP